MVKNFGDPARLRTEPGCRYPAPLNKYFFRGGRVEKFKGGLRGRQENRPVKFLKLLRRRI